MSDELQDSLNDADDSAGPAVRVWQWGDLRARAPLVPPAIGLMAGIGILVDSLGTPGVWESRPPIALAVRLPGPGPRVVVKFEPAAPWTAFTAEATMLAWASIPKSGRRPAATWPM